MTSLHKTVLLQETIDGLNLGKNSLVVDGTFGGGGHSLQICKKFPNTKIVAFDQDKDAFKRADHKFEGLSCDISFINENFRDIDKVLEVLGAKLPSGSLAPKTVDGIILDLGLSSDQLENSGRGFSFMKDEPLLMQMKNSGKENPSREDVTALDVVNTWSEQTIADIIYGYGEEKFSRRIAKAIVDGREKKEIKTTFDLVQIIESAVGGGYKRMKIHPATKTFQAIRIAVNDELGALQHGLEKGFKILKSGGRIAVISFHSLEDRIVKKFFKSKVDEGLGKLINKKIITASEIEIKSNPRSRSAKLRIIEKI